VLPEADDLLAQQLRQLRREYLFDSAKRLDELRQLGALLANGERAALADLHQAFHRLAGSGGSYGFPAVSSTSRDGERLAQRLKTSGAPLASDDIKALDQCIEGVANAFAEAQSADGGDAASEHG
jgi:HPt (histidine-containing phosphotransfer) domain-containing protein